MARPTKVSEFRKAASEIAGEVTAILKEEFGITPDIDQQIAVLSRLRALCDRIAVNGTGEKKGGEHDPA